MDGKRAPSCPLILMVMLKYLLRHIFCFILSLSASRVQASPSLILQRGEDFELQVPLAHERQPYFSDFQTYQGVSCIWIPDRNTNTISGYNPLTKKRVYHWDFNRYGAGVVRTFYLHSPDSILLCTKHAEISRCLFWYHPLTQRVSQIPYASYFHLPGESPDSLMNVWESISVSPASPPSYYKQRIVAGILPYQHLYKTPDIFRHLAFSMDGRGQGFGRLPLFHPSTYRKFPFDNAYGAIRTLIKGDSLLVSFAGSPEVLIWDFERAQLDTLSLLVPGLDMLCPPALDTLLNSGQRLIASGYYGRLFYHASLRLFLRVVYLPTPVVNSTTGLYTLFQERRACLFGWNERFEPQGFTLLPDGANDMNAFCTPQGFMILNPNQSRSDTTGHVRNYTHYEISYANSSTPD